MVNCAIVSKRKDIWNFKFLKPGSRARQRYSSLQVDNVNFFKSIDLHLNSFKVFAKNGHNFLLFD